MGKEEERRTSFTWVNSLDLDYKGSHYYHSAMCALFCNTLLCWLLELRFLKIELSLFGSARLHSAVDANNLPGDIAGAVTDQESHQLSYFFRHTEAP